VRVDIGEGVLISADLFNARNLTLPRVGDEVLVSFPVHACWLM